MNVRISRYTEQKSSFDNILPINIYNYVIWRNGQDGAIIDINNDLIYRFVEAKRYDDGELKDYNYDINDIPIVAVGILAFWLKHRRNGNRLLERFANGTREVEDFLELFDWFTQIKFDQFKENNKKNPDTWDWDWNYEFYTRYIVPHEMHMNKLAEALFDYISDEDISYARSIMRNYIAYLKKNRSKFGYVMNKELLVLRAFSTGDVFQLEDLEDYEVSTILDELEEKGCVYVARIEGHGYEGVRLLDKGKAYLKELEEKRQTPEIPPSENSVQKETFVESVLNDKLDERKVVTALLKTKRLGLGPKQFAFAVKDFFRSISWLTTDIDTKFVSWMKANQIITTASKDLQHVKENDKMEKLKGNLHNTFQLLNGKNKWEDRREYYKNNDSQKINSGM